MTTFGQALNIIGFIAFIATAALWALGKLPIHLAFLTAIATNVVGLVGTQIAGSAWGTSMHVTAIACFAVALVAHRAKVRAQEAEEVAP